MNDHTDTIKDANNSQMGKNQSFICIKSFEKGNDFASFDFEQVVTF